MKRFLAHIPTLILFFSCNVNADSGISKYILLGKDSALSQAGRELAKHGGVVDRKLEFKQGLVTKIPTAALGSLQMRFPDIEFIADVNVQLIEPAEVVVAQGKTPPTPPPPQTVPWGLLAIQALDAHSVTRGAGVTVCVVDTGADKDHSDLAANIIGGRNFISSKGRIRADNWDDDNGHGSHVAGTIAAIDNSIGVIGVAPDAKIYAVKVLDRRGSGTLSGVIDGINACINAGTDVINMSLGATVSPSSSTGLLMQEAVDAARNAGIEVVVAAGNEGQDIANVIPAGLNNLIAVSAVDDNFVFPSWSNFGLSLGDFAAPGVSVLSTYKSGGYSTISGTSMASPHVAGVAALQIAAGKSSLQSHQLNATVSRQGSGIISALKTVTTD